MRTILLNLILMLSIGGYAVNDLTTATVTSNDRDQRMQWFREARFGMFVHFGLYAILGGEWNGESRAGAGEWIMLDRQIPVADYEKLIARFNPTEFDAREWVRIAKDAGMKYIVVTSKHHDGFCLWDSKVSTYTVMATPFKRDLLREIADAAHEAGLKICWYHSIMDWHHPQAQGPRDSSLPTDGGKQKNPEFDSYYRNYLKPQVKELLTNYGEIGIMWFDGEWIPDWSDEYGRDLYDYCRSLQPKVLVNNRVGKGRKGMEGSTEKGAFAGDYDTPEQQVPAGGIPGVDWETCMTMNGTWGFRKDDTNWKTTETLIGMLKDTASKGGNFLLNVGPEPSGVIPQASVERLAGIGEWVRANSQLIYGRKPKQSD